MKKNGFLPRTDSEKETWLRNFANKIAQYSAKYNITAAEVADILASLLYFSYHLNYKTQYGEYLKKLNAYIKEIKDGLPAGVTASVAPVAPTLTAAPPAVSAGIFKRVKAFANRIKSHINYTESDGLDLGIEVSTVKKAKPNLDTIKPTIKVHLIEGGQPEIIWSKNGMDALEIWVDRGDGNDFVRCDIDTKPNYIDNHSLPVKAELWKYKSIYRMDDKIVGHWSDIVSITVVKQLL
ncbi:MAG: hypothetical protein U0U67_14580 [Chitinophagales bacterium]